MGERASGFTSEGLSRFRAHLEWEVETGLHHGSVVLLARGGEIAYHDAIGFSDLNAGRKAATDDIFQLMSVSKGFAAAVILRLIERGRLEFDTRIADIIPEFGVRGKQKVTVAHLLTHTGGTWSGFLPPTATSFAGGGQLAENVAAVSRLAIANPPGERVIYNPYASFSILGHIATLVDERKRCWRGLAREEIFETLGMADTSYGLAVDNPRRVPIRMVDGTPGAAEVEVMESMNRIVDEKAERPGGASFSTAMDLFRFTETLRLRGRSDFGRLLAPPTVDYAYRNHTGQMSNDFWIFSREDRGIPDFPANLTYGGGYVRGEGDHLTPLGRFASPTTFGSVGSGSTMWLVDPEREVVLVYLAAGLLEGLHHFQRLQRVADAAFAALDG